MVIVRYLSRILRKIFWGIHLGYLFPDWLQWKPNEFKLSDEAKFVVSAWPMKLTLVRTGGNVFE